MTKTKTIQHEYGTKEIEVIECSSCGKEIDKEGAYYFIIRDTKNKDDCIRQTNGWACEYCAENPIDYPVILGEFWNRVIKYRLEITLASIFWFVFGALFVIAIP